MLDALAAQVPLKVKVVDIEQDPVLHKLFMEHVPVADLGGGARLYWPFRAEDVLRALNGELRPDEGMSAVPASPRPAVSGRTRDLVVLMDRLIYRFARHWVLAIGLLLGLYTGLPFLAPVLMAGGYTRPANLIYSAYRFACHQLPSRSYFIFGQQMAFCHRDTAIYTSLVLAIIVFGLVGQRLKPLPWQAYLAFLVPMGVDGVTQLFGLRTSTWQLRTLTGALFGIGSAWLILPYLEEAFRDIRRSVEQQLQME
jgi:uncharacterized membrane protein